MAVDVANTVGSRLARESGHGEDVQPQLRDQALGRAHANITFIATVRHDLHRPAGDPPAILVEQSNDDGATWTTIAGDDQPIEPGVEAVATADVDTRLPVRVRWILAQCSPQHWWLRVVAY